MPTGNSIALWYLDQNRIGGAILPTSDGWDWHLLVALREPATNRKTVIDVTPHTLDGDNLVQVRDKHIAAVKAAALVEGYDVTVVVFPAMTLLTGV